MPEKAVGQLKKLPADTPPCLQGYTKQMWEAPLLLRSSAVAHQTGYPEASGLVGTPHRPLATGSSSVPESCVDADAAMAACQSNFGVSNEVKTGQVF